MTLNLQFFFFMFTRRLMQKRMKSQESSVREPRGVQPVPGSRLSIRVLTRCPCAGTALSTEPRCRPVSSPLARRCRAPPGAAARARLPRMAVGDDGVAPGIAPRIARRGDGEQCR